jgi:redox-sensitive bicupin YhaK (pirin superfamily)
MTAGRGIVHAEMPASNTPSRGIQLWINLAREYKMIEPAYQDLKDYDIPRAKPEPGIEVKIIAGESFGVKSSVFTRTPTMILDFKLEKGKKIVQTIPKDHQGFIYVLNGIGYFGGNQFKGEEHSALFLDDNGDHISVDAKDGDLRFVLFTGKPLKVNIINFKKAIFFLEFTKPFPNNLGTYDKLWTFRHELGRRNISNDIRL